MLDIDGHTALLTVRPNVGGHGALLPLPPQPIFPSLLPFPFPVGVGGGA